MLLNISGPCCPIKTKTSKLGTSWTYYTGLLWFRYQFRRLASIGVKWPPFLKCVKYVQKVPSWWSFGLDWSTGAWDIEQPPFCIVMSISQRPINFWRLLSSSMSCPSEVNWCNLTDITEETEETKETKETEVKDVDRHYFHLETTHHHH